MRVQLRLLLAGELRVVGGKDPEANRNSLQIAGHPILQKRSSITFLNIIKGKKVDRCSVLNQLGATGQSTIHPTGGRIDVCLRIG